MPTYFFSRSDECDPESGIELADAEAAKAHARLVSMELGRNTRRANPRIRVFDPLRKRID